MVCGDEFRTDVRYTRYFSMAWSIGTVGDVLLSIDADAALGVYLAGFVAALYRARNGGAQLGFGAGWDRFFLGCGRRRRLGRQFFPIAAFFEAGVHRANLGFLLDNKWCSAFRARLGYGHERCGEIAIRIP